MAPLKEEDAHPASPQDAYGREKLVAERLCLYYTGEFGLETRIVRFHNIYRPYATYGGGREKVPAALCRKVAAVEPGGEIEVWGDGEQTRSFCDGITLRHVDGPQGVRGRNSDNRRLREVLGWEPSVTLRQGLEPTYRWIEKQVTSGRPPWAAAEG